MDNALIKTKDITKVYQMGDVQVHALCGVSLEISQGELVANITIDPHKVVVQEAFYDYYNKTFPEYIEDLMVADLRESTKGTEFEDSSKQEEETAGISIVRSNNRGGMFSYNDKASIEILSPEHSAYITFLLQFQSNSKTRLEQDPEGTIKFLFVISGEINLSVGNIERTLYKGDFVEFDSHKPHYFENRTKKKVTAILYQSPKRF